MKLSEAMRLGAMLKPQGFFDLWTDGGTRSCALGAAYDALGCGSPCTSDDRPVHIKLWLTGLMVPCPECNFGDSFRGHVITHLNDNHRWTRERIADWVESIERSEQPPAVAAVDPVLAKSHELTTREPVS